MIMFSQIVDRVWWIRCKWKVIWWKPRIWSRNPDTRCSCALVSVRCPDCGSCDGVRCLRLWVQWVARNATIPCLTATVNGTNKGWEALLVYRKFKQWHIEGLWWNLEEESVESCDWDFCRFGIGLDTLTAAKKRRHLLDRQVLDCFFKCANL